MGKVTTVTYVCDVCKVEDKSDKFKALGHETGGGHLKGVAQLQNGNACWPDGIDLLVCRKCWDKITTFIEELQDGITEK